MILELTSRIILYCFIVEKKSTNIIPVRIYCNNKFRGLDHCEQKLPTEHTDIKLCPEIPSNVSFYSFENKFLYCHLFPDPIYLLLIQSHLLPLVQSITISRHIFRTSTVSPIRHDGGGRGIDSSKSVY